MQKSPADEEIKELERKIKTLQWDIPNIMDSRLKAFKEDILKKYKERLNNMLEERKKLQPEAEEPEVQ